jgi:hypothetical protein
MSHQDSSENNVQSQPTDFLWGADNIGRVIGRTRRQTHHLLASGRLKSAKKIGGSWVANRIALISELSAAE